MVKVLLRNSKRPCGAKNLAGIYTCVNVLFRLVKAAYKTLSKGH